MAKRSKTKSFVAEFPLRVHRAQARVLRNRFLASGNLYNGVLGEIQAREHRMRADPAWQAARKLPKGNKNTDEGKLKNKARHVAFNALKVKHQFSEYSLQKYAEKMRDSSWINHHMGSSDCQTIARRAFKATENWVYDIMGKPHYKPSAEQSSIEGKTNDAVIRFRGDKVLWDGLELPILFKDKDPYGWQADALACETKYCRILKQDDKTYSVQLVQEGLPPSRNRIFAKEGEGCYDLGTKTIGLYIPEVVAGLIPLNTIGDFKEKELAKIRQAMDRSRRSTNPKNYNSDGTIKKGRKTWVYSRKYNLLKAEAKELERKLAAERKRERGELTNQMLALAPKWKTENTSGKAMQKNFGKSVGRNAPATFAAELDRKAVEIGGGVTRFSTYKTKLSQYDHIAKDYVKKPLSMREHHFRDGVTLPLQRDVYSAFLGCYVYDDLLDASKVEKAWLSAEPLLRLPVSSLTPLIPKRQKRPHGRHGHAQAPAGMSKRQRELAIKSTSTPGTALRDKSPAKAAKPLRKSSTSTKTASNLVKDYESG